MIQTRFKRLPAGPSPSSHNKLIIAIGLLIKTISLPHPIPSTALIDLEIDGLWDGHHRGAAEEEIPRRHGAPRRPAPEEEAGGCAEGDPVVSDSVDDDGGAARAGGEEGSDGDRRQLPARGDERLAFACFKLVSTSAPLMAFM
ncbi:hypothetical protein HPP92_009718 [Vanilla planifolia]|uniref:Uncharacterized protein n=1 Tax=Vanilla planifolia TaxID=51239 RepID=A0A835RJV7_VANPL|nr:hypothetical protein HPP92_009718 [Vanilla planifolia]